MVDPLFNNMKNETAKKILKLEEVITTKDDCINTHSKETKNLKENNNVKQTTR